MGLDQTVINHDPVILVLDIFIEVWTCQFRPCGLFSKSFQVRWGWEKMGEGEEERNISACGGVPVEAPWGSAGLEVRTEGEPGVA